MTKYFLIFLALFPFDSSIASDSLPIVKLKFDFDSENCKSTQFVSLSSNAKTNLTSIQEESVVTGISDDNELVMTQLETGFKIELELIKEEGSSKYRLSGYYKDSPVLSTMIVNGFEITNVVAEPFETYDASFKLNKGVTRCMKSMESHLCLTLM